MSEALTQLKAAVDRLAVIPAEAKRAIDLPRQRETMLASAVLAEKSSYSTGYQPIHSVPASVMLEVKEAVMRAAHRDGAAKVEALRSEVAALRATLCDLAARASVELGVFERELGA